MKYLKSIFIFVALFSFFVFSPKVFAAVHTFNWAGPTEVTQELSNTVFGPGDTMTIWGSMHYTGSSSTTVSMTATLNMVDKIVINSSTLTNYPPQNSTANGSTTFTVPLYPGNFVVHFVTQSGNSSNSYDFPFTVLPDPVVSMSSYPSNSVTYGSTAFISWTSTNANSCISSGGGGSGTSGNFTTSPLFSTTTFSVICFNSTGSGNTHKTITVGPPPPPSANLIATPPDVSSGGSSVISWTSYDIDWCDLHLNNINGPVLVSGVSNTGFNVGPLSATTSYFLHCQRNAVVTQPSSCSGQYVVTDSQCVGTLGGNTCGFPESGPDSLCSQFTIDGCVVESDPWCHHACHVASIDTINSCNGLNYNQCNSHNTCTWHPEVATPAVIVDKMVTVTVNTPPNLPTVNVVRASDQAEDSITVVHNTNVGLKVNTTNIIGCTVLKDGVVLVNEAFTESPIHLFSTGSLVTRTNPYLYEVSCEGTDGDAVDTMSITVTANSLPDLTMGLVSPNTATTGVAKVFNATISNIGAVSTPTVVNYFFQVTDPNGNITDLMPAATPILSSQQSRDLTISYTFPSSGTYTIRACADKLNRNDAGTIYEGEANSQEETNNCSSSWTEVIVSPDPVTMPDLTASVSTPTSAVVGQSVNLTSTISNNSSAGTGHSFSNFFQVTDDAQNTNNGGGNGTALFTTQKALAAVTPPTDLVAIVMSALGPNGSAETIKGHTFTVAGTYYVRACADKSSSANIGTVSESNENNNCGPWATVIVAPLLPDLKASASTPSSALLNTPVNLTSTITNQGPVSTGRSFYNFFQVTTDNPNTDNNNGGGNSPAFLSTQKAIAATGNGGGVQDIDATLMATLLSGQSRTTVKSYIFTTVDTYYIRACADKSSSANMGLVAESNELNNCGAWTSLTVNDSSNPMPNLTAGLVTPNTATVNVPVVLRSTISNNGNASTGHSFYNFIQISTTDPNGWGNQGNNASRFFSTSKVLAANGNTPIELEGTVMQTLNAGASAVTTKNYTFTSAGTYYVRACADKSSSANMGTVNESYENDNCGITWTTIVVSPSSDPMPDLTASFVTPTTATVNVPVALKSTITNQGNASTGVDFSNFIQYYPVDSSSLPVITDLPPVLMRRLGSLATDITTKQHTFTVSGTYYVRACADKINRNTTEITDDVTESDETNNCGAWTLITVSSLSNKPDLVAGPISPTSGLVNTEISFSSTITNQGNVSTGSSFNNFIQIASLANGQGNLTPQPSTQMATLGAGASRITSTKYKFEATGAYSARACADKSKPDDLGTINEGDESNNCGDWTNIRIVTDVINASCGPVPTHWECVPNTIIATNTNAYVNNQGDQIFEWICPGVAGGTDASCVQNLGPVGEGSASCGPDAYTCIQGEPSNQTETQTEYKWQCVAKNGNIAPCSKLKDSFIGIPSCSDKVKNGDETGVDCGGSCPRCDIIPKYQEN